MKRDLTNSRRPEHELLLCAGRTCSNLDVTGPVRDLVHRGLDWAYLMRCVFQHDMTPFVYPVLSEVCPEAVPGPIMTRLSEQYHGHARRNLFLTGELLRLMDLFQTEGIPVVPFKGVTMLASVYGDVAAREIDDLDILVRKQDVLKAKAVLAAQGYKSTIRLTPAQEAALLDSHFEWLFARDDEKVHVDLHWAITPAYLSFTLDLDRLEGRLMPVSLNGREVPTLSPEDLLVLVCGHGTKHRWPILKMVCDVAKLVGRERRLDWTNVMRQAEAMGCVRMVLLGLVLAGSLLKARVPDEVLQRADADPVVQSLAAQVGQRLFLDTNGRPGAIETYRFYSRAMDRFRDKRRYLFDVVASPTIPEWELVSLPSSLSFLYYPIRGIRLLGKYGLRPFKRRRNGASAEHGK
jgi:hypothetical protein